LSRNSSTNAGAVRGKTFDETLILANGSLVCIVLARVADGTRYVVVTAVGFFVATDEDGLGFFVIGFTDVDGLGFFVIGFFVAASTTTAMNATNVTRRIEKNFIVGWIVC
jgi:hypothetical protein